MHKKELLALADYMDAIPDPSLYEQNSWIKGLDDANVAVEYLDGTSTPKITLPENFCGTSACVLGHAALAPALKHLGLFVTGKQYHFKDNEVPVGIPVINQNGKKLYFSYFGIGIEDDDGNIAEDFEAAMIAFDITENEAELMFGSTDIGTLMFYLGDEYVDPNWDENEDAVALQINKDNEAKLTPQRVAKAIRKFVETDGASAAEFDY